MQPIAPCKDCPDRDAVNNCHDRYEKYQAFRTERREFNLKMHELSSYNAYVTDRKAKIRDSINKKKQR